MIWLYVYLGISVLTFILFLFCSLESSREFKRRYPDIKGSQLSLIERIGGYIRFILIAFIPVVNIFYFWVLLFKSETIKEKTVEAVYLKRTKTYEASHDN